jgi:FixJ family two-component response regulator
LVVARTPIIRADDLAMESHPGTVGVVDDDSLVRAVLENLLSSMGLRVEAFASAHECLSRIGSEIINCLVVDIRLPGKSGLELYDELTRANLAPPVIFISGHHDVRVSVRAMKAGALDFLPKPFGEQELLDAVQRGIQQDRVRRVNDKIVAELGRRYQSLTTREREIMACVASGRRNKTIADDLGVTDITVKAHRSQVMSKMRAQSVVELIGMAQLLGHMHAQPLSLVASEAGAIQRQALIRN